MNVRMKELRKYLNKTQAEFGKDIGLTQNYIAQIEMGRRDPSDRSISDMVRIFNVNEVWLRDGVGEMFLERTIEDEIDAFCGSIKKLEKDDPRWCVMRLLAKLPEEDWDAIADMIKLIKEEN